MGIAGRLTDFPLPEVLLLIGSRTGRLRIFDIPDVDDMELELAEGYAHALHLGGSCLNEDREITTQLSVIVSKGDGKFEFRPGSDISSRREQPLLINNLVILMVLYVDEVLARQNTPASTEPIYQLQSPQPEIWIDPNLNTFFQQCQSLLISGARAEEISAFLGLPNDEVRLNMAYLRQLGFVQILDPTGLMPEIHVEQDISQKSTELKLAAQASDFIRRTGKIVQLPARPT